MAIILNIETATKNCSVSIANNGAVLVLKELNDKYAPLYDLKMQSKIEGIELGLEIAAAEHKRSHNAELARVRSLV